MFSIFEKLRWFIKTYRREYGISILLLLLNYVLAMIPPWLIGEVADQIRLGELGLQQLLNYSALYAVLIISSYVISLIWQYLLFRGSDLVGRATRRRFVSKLLLQSPIFYEKNTTGSLMGKATNDVRSIQDFGGYGMMALVEAMIAPVAIILMMGFGISWKLTLASVLPLPFVIITSKWIGDKLYLVYDQVQKSFDRMNETVLENVTGVRVIRAYVRENSEMERFGERAEDLFDNNMKGVRLTALFPPVSRIFPGMSYLIAFGFGAYLIGQGSITIGNMVSFVVYLNMLTWPMFALGDFINVSEQASASMDRIQEVLDYPEDMVDREGAVAYSGGMGIRFDDFSFRYPKSTQNALTDIDLELPHGKTLGVVGRIGSGKTTLLKQLLRYYPVTENSLYLGEHPVEAYQTRSIREHIGYVPQQHVLFSKSAQENIRFGKRGESMEEELMASIAAADFEKDLAQLPDGLDTMVGERGMALSGGQKQRISIARALIGDPEILILDDSLSAVDAKTEENILANLHQLRRGKTNLIAAHRLSGIAHADEIIVLEEGRIVERGTHDQLFAQGGWYKKQFLLQQLEGASDGK
ncbi:MAG: ABC transporter ATP-binding protein [Tissierellia bacterium]|nr:ABC transporter ATP-binding protein [Tissierellia bacterium]